MVKRIKSTIPTIITLAVAMALVASFFFAFCVLRKQQKEMDMILNPRYSESLEYYEVLFINEYTQEICNTYGQVMYSRPMYKITFKEDNGVFVTKEFSIYDLITQEHNTKGYTLVYNKQTGTYQLLIPKGEKS